VPTRRLSIFILTVVACLASFTGLTACSKPDPRPTIRAELRSWIVAGRGRHLYLTIFPSTPNAKPERIEFGSTAQRTDYRGPKDFTKAARVARMTPGVILSPILAAPDNRLEAEYWLTEVQANILRRDRVFSAPYELTARNSNAAMARALKDAGLALPTRVAQGAGLLGEFPGINLDPGKDIAPSHWSEYGVTPQPSRRR
jgi:hypothetical protein